uniref:Uncharacterized protein n=1 Tax=Tanacetum cinerariifolium TaxID=118510 RepID=A0A6L2JMM7_TANCI|nr:hypothetical protein [Tanacetum cinerariifolium]
MPILEYVVKMYEPHMRLIRWGFLCKMQKEPSKYVHRGYVWNSFRFRNVIRLTCYFIKAMMTQTKLIPGLATSPVCSRVGLL